ncbi:hypothetical protein GCM10025872_27850 [Barrientosiimonas endolithica]|uniref:Glycosyltransferase subfamily 4-like N-terminal domain-containing protein n=1 Tax=Barrientosiimonas endolithica TaxID=1535208 RepID=A0ABM8HDS2_9MICO|nr:hypothetical protein GCM10025872_27850 [Barrientosiimonas endolithica]
MRVALLSDCYLPRLGGIEVQVHDLARSLREAGHEAVIITATQGPDEPIDDVPVERLAIPLPGGVPVNPLRRRRFGGCCSTAGSTWRTCTWGS